MCGRYALALRASQVRQMLLDDDMPVDEAPDDGDNAARQSYNFAPGYHGIVYRAATPDWGAGPAPPRAEPRAEPQEPDKTRYRLQAMKWGLIPFWTKRNPDYATMLKTINCRDDSLGTPGGMWAAIKGRKRCLVIAQGFFEWLKTGPRDKLPHFVKRRDGRLMCFAGLWDCVEYQASEEKTYTYTIITTDSNPQLRFLHHRMPVIFDPGSDEIRTWLDPAQHEWTRSLQSLLRPFDGELEVYPVSKEVGKVGNDASSFIVPLDSKENKSNIANFFSSQSSRGSREGEKKHKMAEQEAADAEPPTKKAAVGESQSPAKKVPTGNIEPPAKKTWTNDSNAEPSPTRDRKKRDPTRNQGRSPVKQKDPGSQKITKFFGNSA